MEETIRVAGEFLASYGYLVVFAWIFADQAALPLPSAPILVAAGAVGATGGLDIGWVIAVATVAALLADSLWYALGRYRGATAIAYVCRLSLEPDSCVSTTRNAFARFGPATLVLAKFLPGVQTLAPASAGFVRAPWLGFLLLDLIGTLLFIVPFCLGGYFFQAELVAFLNAMGEVSGGVATVVVCLVAVYLGFKAVQWALFWRGHRLRRMTSEALNARFSNDEPVTVVDLRQQMDYQLVPAIIPGALRIPIGEVPRRRGEIPTDHDVILVCT